MKEKQIQATPGSDRDGSLVGEVALICFPVVFNENCFLGGQRMFFRLISTFLWTAACFPHHGVDG